MRHGIMSDELSRKRTEQLLYADFAGQAKDPKDMDEYRAWLIEKVLDQSKEIFGAKLEKKALGKGLEALIRPAENTLITEKGEAVGLPKDLKLREDEGVQGTGNLLRKEINVELRKTRKHFEYLYKKVSALSNAPA